MVVEAEVEESGKTTLGSERRSVLKKSLTEPTLLEMSGNATYQDLTPLQSLESLQSVDKRALVVTNEGAEEAL